MSLFSPFSMSANTATFDYPASRDRNVMDQRQGHVDPAFITSHLAGLSMGAVGMQQYPTPIHMGHPPAVVMGPDGQMMYTPAMHHPQSLGAGPGADNMYHNYAMGTGGFAGPPLGMPLSFVPLTPGRIKPSLQADGAHCDVPALEGHRRGSYSTTESTPATPFYAAHHREAGPRVASAGRSSYTTPSPQQLDSTPSKTAFSSINNEMLDELLQMHPHVPRAVPAVFTPATQMKSVEQSLDNRIPGNRNVYIRGLHPTTDDDTLYAFASRFGKVETSKAIIDTSTGACKGFGFAKFRDLRDSEKCIRGFHRLGYEVGFARESFNSRLKAEGDDDSTNLYISNLPKTLTELELQSVFDGYNILSSKILRDNMGNSRGVGFARFESRDVCDEVIRKFNGVATGNEGLLMNIRYADTPAQKELKRITAERRQFRTNEYNIGAYGTPLVGLTPSLNMDNRQYHWARNSSTVRMDRRSALREDGNVMSHSGGSLRQSEQSMLAGQNKTSSTPASSESDEGVTLRPCMPEEDCPHSSTQSSPIKKTAAREN